MNCTPLHTTLPVLLLLVLLSPVTRAQHALVWPVHYDLQRGRWYNEAPVKEGYIVQTSGDTLRGFIKLLPAIYTNYYPVLDTATHKLRSARTSTITTIRIYDHTPEGPFAEYVNLHYKQNLWRVDSKAGAVALYDNTPKGRIQKYILVSNSKRIKLYSSFAWLITNGNTDAMLLRFIRKRYKLVMMENDFKSTGNMYAFIVNKEVERLAQSNAPEAGTQ